jgi:hypothetical protein
VLFHKFGVARSISVNGSLLVVVEVDQTVTLETVCQAVLVVVVGWLLALRMVRS